MIQSKIMVRYLHLKGKIIIVIGYEISIVDINDWSHIREIFPR